MFGELVALLWASGREAATVELERFWNELMQTEEITLICGYPAAGLAGGPESRVREVLDAHTKVVRR